MSERLVPIRKFDFSRLDCLIGALLCSLALAYGVGYRRGSQPAEKDKQAAEDAAVAAAAVDVVENASKQPSAEILAVKGADPKEKAWEKMTDELEHLAAGHRGRVAIYLQDLKTNKTWTFHPDDLFPSASLIKVPVMACVFSKIHDGGLSLNDTLTLRKRNRVGGSGTLKWRNEGSRFTVRELLGHMISESDNTATAMLIEAMGIGYVQQQFPKMGLFYTELYPEGMSLNGGRVAHENYTTAREMTMLMQKIYNGELVDRDSSELMLDILKHKKPTASRLAKGLPAGWSIAHKTGLLRQACHDSAVIMAPTGDYALTVLTGQNTSYRVAKDFITRLGRITFRHYRGEYYVAKAGRRHSQLAVR